MGEVPEGRRGLSLKSLLPFSAYPSRRFAATHPPLTRSPLPLKREGWWVFHKAALPQFARRHLCGEAAELSAAGESAFLIASS